MKPNQWIDRARAPRGTWIIAVLVFGFTLLTPLWAAPQAPGPDEFVHDAGALYPDEQQLETIVQDRYPQLVTQRVAGLPVVVALFNHDGTLAATDLEISVKDPRELSVSELCFVRFGLRAQDLTYMGVVRIELPSNTVLIMYGGRRS